MDNDRSHHLRMAETVIGIVGLQGMTTTELVALNAVLAPAHSRFLRSARVDRRRRRGAARRQVTQ